MEPERSPASIEAAPVQQAQLEGALDGSRAASRRLIARLRLCGAGSFLLLALLLRRHEQGWSVLVAPLGVYALVALLLFLADRRGSRRLRRVAAATDVLIVFALQYTSLPASEFPAGVAGFSLGLFALLLVLGALTSVGLELYATALLAWICEAVLQRSTGVGWGAVVAAAVVLLLVAIASSHSERRHRRLVVRLVEEEVARRVVTERSAALARAHHAVQESNRALAAKHAELLAAQRNAEALTGFLVHDMKAPLTGLTAFIGLAAAAQPKGSAALDDLEEARGQARRLLGMIGDLLTLSRLEAGQGLVAAVRPTPVAPVLEAAQATLEAQARQLGASVEVRAPAGLSWPLDGALLQRLLENLGSNALGFLKSGDRLELWAEVRGGELLLAVRNSGPPIPDEVRGRLFQKHVTSGRSRHNVGLGLYFCRLVAEAHHGSIALEDAPPPWNVSFLVRLPAAAAPPAAA